MASTLNGIPVIHADVRMERVGAWHARLMLNGQDVDPIPTEGDPAELDLEGIEFSGTVLRAGANGGRIGARIVGGKGKLTEPIEAQHWKTGSGVTVRELVEAILGDGGESLSDTSDASILGQTVASWAREAETVSHCLVTLLDVVGASWRVLRDGTVWVGVDTYPELEIEHRLLDEDWSEGVLFLAPDAPDLLPAVTFLGHRLELVRHLVSTKLRTEAYLTSQNSAIERFLGNIRRQIDYTRAYAARVSKQNSDGSLQVVPDDPRVKGSGLDKVPYRLGVPGSVQVPAGQRVVLRFESGNPALPFAESWGKDTLTLLNLGAATDFAAHAAKVDTRIQTLENSFDSFISTYNSHFHPHPNGPTSPTAQTGTPNGNGSATACAKVKVE